MRMATTPNRKEGCHSHFLEIIFFYTGEIVLFLISFGWKKPRWDYYADASGSKFVIFTEISEWIGILFWISIVALIGKIFK